MLFGKIAVFPTGGIHVLKGGCTGDFDSLDPHSGHKTGNNYSMRKLAISVLVFSLFSTTYLLAREELLLKIPENSNQQLRILSERYGVKLRYRTSDLSIIQVSRSDLPGHR